MVWPLDEECYPNCDLNRLEATSACIARLEAIYLRCGNVIAHGLACHDAAKLYEKLKAREHAVAKCRDAIDVWTRVGHCQRLTYSSFLEGRILNEWAADTPQGPLRATHLGDAWKALQAADDANQKCCEERGVEKGQFGIWILQQQASTKELAGHWADAEHLHAKILQKCKDVRKSLGSEYSEDPGDYYRSELSDYEAKARFGQQRARASAGRRHS
jgi:hypothetical protein